MSRRYCDDRYYAKTYVQQTNKQTDVTYTDLDFIEFDGDYVDTGINFSNITSNNNYFSVELVANTYGIINNPMPVIPYNTYYNFVRCNGINYNLTSSITSSSSSSEHRSLFMGEIYFEEFNDSCITILDGYLKKPYEEFYYEIEDLSKPSNITVTLEKKRVSSSYVHYYYVTQNGIKTLLTSRSRGFANGNFYIGYPNSATSYNANYFGKSYFKRFTVTINNSNGTVKETLCNYRAVLDQNTNKGAIYDDVSKRLIYTGANNYMLNGIYV